MIKANEYIKTAFSANDAENLARAISPVFEAGENVTVDFSEITIFTTLFFNNVFAKYLIEIGPQEYNRKFELVNLSELGETTYQHSYENAVSYYNLSKEDREEQNNDLETLDEN